MTEGTQENLTFDFDGKTFPAPPSFNFPVGGLIASIEPTLIHDADAPAITFRLKGQSVQLNDAELVLLQSIVNNVVDLRTTEETPNAEEPENGEDEAPDIQDLTDDPLNEEESENP